MKLITILRPLHLLSALPGMLFAQDLNMADSSSVSQISAQVISLQ